MRGPIDGGPNAPERRLHAWPLDEAYIDSADCDPSAGLVNDPAGFPTTVDRATLRAVNERGGEDASQLRAVSTQPGWARDFARRIAGDLERAGEGRVAVYADLFVSSNGRPARQVFDPSLDLAHTPEP